MNNIDILEELKNKQYTNKDILGNLVLSEEEYTAISNLISENKELKEEKEELKRENLEIRDWKYVIDSPIDLDKLKELDLIKIKGKEYISVDKIKAKIEEYDDKGMTVNLANRSAGKTFQQVVHYEVIKVLQSLLGKE